MNIATLLGVAGLIIACAIPFIIIQRKNKKAQAEFTKSLFQFAEKQDNKILTHELSSRIAIGMSETFTLFFIKKLDNRVIQQSVDLTQINGCRVSKSTRSGVDGTSTTSKIELIFDSDSNLPTTRLEFYDLESDGFVLHGELQMAEKWRDQVLTLTKKKKQA